MSMEPRASRKVVITLTVVVCVVLALGLWGAMVVFSGGSVDATTVVVSVAIFMAFFLAAVLVMWRG